MLRFPVDRAPSATWPWKGARESEIFPGVARWTRRAEDGTELELLRFDFDANPRLRFELYDQDEDDAKPFDNKAEYLPNGVGKVTEHLNAIGRGKVLAAWNGLFFAYDRSPGSPPGGWATHIGPVALNGKVRYNVGQHRWTFGVKLDAYGKPAFKTFHMPDAVTVGLEFDYAAPGAQCLVHKGVAKSLEAPPLPGRRPPEPPVPSTPREAGHIPWVDHIRTSRTSMGWTKDSRLLYVLFVNEPDTETASKKAVRDGQPSVGGWNLADLQYFLAEAGSVGRG